MAQSPAREIYRIRHLRQREPPVIIIANERSYVCNSWVHRGASKDLRVTNRFCRTKNPTAKPFPHLEEVTITIAMTLMDSFQERVFVGEVRRVVALDPQRRSATALTLCGPMVNGRGQNLCL